MASSKELNAGGFSSWLSNTRNSLIKERRIKVPCDACTACCRSSMFIHIKPEETETLARIPKELQFPAPGLPKGHFVLGYDNAGKCPMLIDNQCSIYDCRPSACGAYDCRIFSAVGILALDSTKTLIAQQAQRWKFTYPTHSDHKQHLAVQAAAGFLSDHAGLFPSGFVSQDLTQLAILAIKVCDVFYRLHGKNGESIGELTDVEIVKMVSAAFDKFESRDRR